MKTIQILLIITQIIYTQVAASKSISSVFSCHSAGNDSARIKLGLSSDKNFLLNIHIIGDEAPLIFSGQWSKKQSLYYLNFDKKHEKKVIARLFPSKVNSIKMIKPYLGTFAESEDKINIWGVYCFKDKK